MDDTIAIVLFVEILIQGVPLAKYTADNILNQEEGSIHVPRNRLCVYWNIMSSLYSFRIMD